MRRLHIEHNTRHDYEEAVSFSNHALFLRPLDSHRRRVNWFCVETTPASQQRWLRDVHGNLVMACSFGLTESRALEFKTSIEVDIEPENPFDFVLEPYATKFPFFYKESEGHALSPFIEEYGIGDAKQARQWRESAVETPDQYPDSVAFLAEINKAILRDIAYERRDEEGIQSPDTTLDRRKGSCRDAAALFIAVARQLGIAARFVSGYLYDPPTGEEDERIFNRAVGSMHAWAEIYLPGAGWKGFDPTNGILSNGFFIPCAVSHDPAAVDPIQGTYFAKHTVASSMQVDLEIRPANDP